MQQGCHLSPRMLCLLHRQSKQGWQQPARVHHHRCRGSASAIVFPLHRSQWGCSVLQSYAALAGTARDVPAGRAAVMSWRAVACRDTDSAAPGLMFVTCLVLAGCSPRAGLTLPLLPALL